MTAYLDIIFHPADDGPGLTFVEVERPGGLGVDVGQWVTRPDGYRALRLRPSDFAEPNGSSE